MDWYILKVQSNREDSIAEALRKRVKVAGFEEHFQEIIVPVEISKPDRKALRIASAFAFRGCCLMWSRKISQRVADR